MYTHWVHMCELYVSIYVYVCINYLYSVGLSHLCEFIEDCEHIDLAIRILHLLGREGPRTQKPYKYIRFIYNRVLLEAPAVRAAAVSSLAKFGASCEDLNESVMVLLEHCLLDNNDEVRDRALLYLEVLRQKQKALSSAYILNRKFTNSF